MKNLSRFIHTALITWFIAYSDIADDDYDIHSRTKMMALLLLAADGIVVSAQRLHCRRELFVNRMLTAYELMERRWRFAFGHGIARLTIRHWWH